MPRVALSPTPLNVREHAEVDLGAMMSYFAMQLEDHSTDISVRLCHAFAIRDPISTNNTYETVHSVYQGYLIIRGNMSQFSRALFFSLFFPQFIVSNCPFSPYNL